MDPRDEFLAHRRRQEAQAVAQLDDHDDPLGSVTAVELNTTELCNRTCVFCPRVDPSVYPNRNLHMTVPCAAKVAGDLAAFGYKGRVSFSGFGEPTLNKAFPALIRAVRDRLPDCQIDTNTNGDKLTAAAVARLYDAGITFLYVNLYDGPAQRPHFQALFADAGIAEGRYALRPHWSGAAQDYGLILNNRSGMVVDANHGLPLVVEPLRRPCYLPFSHAMIDWNGDMLLCSNDWGRALVIGTIWQHSFADLWLSPAMLDARRRLMESDRRQRPCSTCSVNGMLGGRHGFDLLVSYYEKHGFVEKQRPSAVHSAASDICNHEHT